MSDIQAAIVGAGFMGRTHTEALRRLGIPIHGLLGRDGEETCHMAAVLNIEHCYESFAELCADPAITAVHLCTPNYLHYPMAREALLAGKHVFCEKPLATTSSEAQELVELARERELVAAVNYSVRFYPLNQEARARVQAGLLGEPRILRAEYCQDWLFLPSDWNWRLDPQEGGNLRVVGDIGTHVMDMLCWISGLQITSVMADLATFLPQRHRPANAADTFGSKLSTAVDTVAVDIHTEDYAAIMLRFDNGARGVIALSQVSAGRKNNFCWEINGSLSSLAWRQERPNELWMGYREKPNEILLKDPALMMPEARPYAAYPGGHAEGYPDSFVRHFSDFYAAVAAGAGSMPATFPSFEDGWRELVLCEAIERSAQERRWVDVPAHA